MIAAVLLIAAGLVSCEPDKACRQDMTVTAGVGLRGLYIDTADVVTEFSGWDSITVQGVGNDSVLYDNSKLVSQLQLPLRNDTDLTAYTLTYHGTEDKLYFHHDNTMRFVSMACGCIIYHQIDSVWCEGTWIDSVKIINSAVEGIVQENVKVYLTLKIEN